MFIPRIFFEGQGTNPGGTPPAGSPPAGSPPEEKSWRESIKDEEIRKHTERFTDVEALAKGHKDLRAKLSSAIVKPGKDASDEDRAAYRKSMGVPETADEYKIMQAAEGKEFPDSLKASIDKWQKTFHDLDVPLETANKLIATMIEETKLGSEDYEKAKEKFAKDSEDALIKEWGKDDYEINKKIADHAGRNLLSEEKYDVLKDTLMQDGKPFMDSPIGIELLAAVGREMQEGGIRDFVTEGNDPKDLDKQIETARANANKYNDQNSSDYNRKKANEWDQEEGRLEDIKARMKKK